MKKFILVGMIIVGMLSFSEMIATTAEKGKTWEDVFIDNNIYGLGKFWASQDRKYIMGFGLDKNENIVIKQFYRDKKSASGEKIGDFDLDGVNWVYGSYTVYSSDRKGVFYLKNFVDADGKKYSKLYFGFDEIKRIMIITDKDGNEIEILVPYFSLEPVKFKK